MKTQLINLSISLATIVLIIIARVYKFMRKMYRRFCICVLWKKFCIRTSVYQQWHDRRAVKLQALLDAERANRENAYSVW